MNGIKNNTLGGGGIGFLMLLSAEVIGNNGIGANGKSYGNGIDQVLYREARDKAVMAFSLIFAT